MYKVFINDKPIILTSSFQNEETFSVQLFKRTVVDEVIYRLKNENIEGIVLHCDNLEQDWENFKNNFKVVFAGGGLVTNENQDILFIYRNDKWDLPKGRIEEGESIDTTAIREVEEECGIKDLQIKQKLITTWHIYYQNQYCLKETHWFLMDSNYKGELKPQVEEGITAVKFISNSDIHSVLSNSYSNIKLTYKAFKNLDF
jgi:ADP-ribose pyrophosphatase YjhB (NUDIX family)